MRIKNISGLWGWKKTPDTYERRYQGWKKFYNGVSDKLTSEFFSFTIFYGIILVFYYLYMGLYSFDYLIQNPTLYFYLPFLSYVFLWLIWITIFILIIPKIVHPYLSKHNAAHGKVI